MKETKTGGGGWTKVAIMLAMAVIAIFMLTRYDVRGFTPEAIKDRMLTFGVWAPVVFVALYTLRPLILFPASIFSLAGGLAFGTFFGGFLNYTGCVLSAMLAFFLARYLGRGFVEKILRGKLKDFDNHIEKEGFTILFYIRFFAPFDPISYACGLSKMKFTTYMAATMIPLLPGTFAYANLGNVVSSMKSFSDLLSLDFILSVGLIVLVVMIPVAIKKISKSKVGPETEPGGAD